MQLNTLRYLINKQVILTLTILGLIASSFIALTITQAQDAPIGYKLVWNDEFNNTNVDSNKWNVTHQTRSTESHHQGRYLDRNTSVANGNLEIVTERHCVASGELPSDANRSSAPCPTDKTTAYSSGQVKSDYNWNSGKMEIRAKLPETTQSGLWSGYWLRQKGTWCTQQYGEIDILEWYSDPKSTSASTATSHISCANDKLTSRQHVQKVNGSLANSWHTWGVEWDTSGITYYLDGKVVPSISSHRPDDDNQSKDTLGDFEGVTSSLFEQVMNQPWQLRINTQVYGETDQWHEAPDDTASFTPQTFLVDYVRVYAKDDTPIYKSQSPPETTQHSAETSKPTATTDAVQSDEVKLTIASTDNKNHDDNIAEEESAVPSSDDNSEVTTEKAEKPALLPQTGAGQWAIFGGLPISLMAAAGYAWHHSRLKLK